MEDLLLAARILLGIGMISAFGMVISGLIDMQRINTQDPDVLELTGTVRRLDDEGRRAQLIITADDEVFRVRCSLHGGRCQVTDLVPVLWRRGSDEAVAAETIARGQRRFLLGILLLTAAVAAMLML